MTLVKIVSHTAGDAAQDLHPTILLSVYSVQNYTVFPYPDILSSAIICFQFCLHFMFSTLLLFHIFSAPLQRFSDAPHRLRRQIIAQSWSGLLRIVVGAKAKMIFSQTAAPCPRWSWPRIEQNMEYQNQAFWNIIIWVSMKSGKSGQSQTGWKSWQI